MVAAAAASGIFLLTLNVVARGERGAHARNSRTHLLIETRLCASAGLAASCPLGKKLCKKLTESCAADAQVAATKSAAWLSPQSQFAIKWQLIELDAVAHLLLVQTLALRCVISVLSTGSQPFVANFRKLNRPQQSPKAFRSLG